LCTAKRCCPFRPFASKSNPTTHAADKSQYVPLQGSIHKEVHLEIDPIFSVNAKYLYVRTGGLISFFTSLPKGAAASAVLNVDSTIPKHLCRTKSQCLCTTTACIRCETSTCDLLVKVFRIIDMRMPCGYTIHSHRQMRN